MTIHDMRIIAALVWALLLIVVTTCPLMAGCGASAEDQSDDCCQRGSCSRKPQHSDDCPYKIRDARQAEVKFNLMLDASVRGQIGAVASVAVVSRSATLVAPATHFPESDRFLTLGVLRI